MYIIKNNTRKKMFKKVFLTVCNVTVFTIIQASQINAIASNQGDIEINEAEEEKISVNNEGPKKYKSKSGCGGINAEVQVPGVNVKANIKPANMEMEFDK